jgi:beta-glucosidase/6-phospho-beta-glucosidase/beta-galactosidase
MTVLSFKRNTFNYSNNIKTIENHELDKLENIIIKSREDIRSLHIELKNVETEISMCLDEYYKISSSEGDSSVINKLQKSSGIVFLNQSIKKLYNKIIEICNIKSEKKEAITFSDEEFSLDNLEDLINIEFYLNGKTTQDDLSPEDKLHQLGNEFEVLLNKITAYKNDNSSIFGAALSELKRQAVWAKIRSEDLINQTKKEIAKHLTLRIKA